MSLNRERTETQKQIAEDIEYYYLKNLFNTSIQCENTFVRDCDLCFYNDTNKVNLSSLLLHSPKLICRVSGAMCSPCVKFGIQEIEKILGKKKSNVIFVTSDMSFIEKERLLGGNFYSLPDNSFLTDLQIEEYGIPFFFILDNTMQVRLLFIPEKTAPWYTEKYLLEISRFIGEYD